MINSRPKTGARAKVGSTPSNRQERTKQKTKQTKTTNREWWVGKNDQREVVDLNEHGRDLIYRVNRLVFSLLEKNENIPERTRERLTRKASKHG